MVRGKVHPGRKVQFLPKMFSNSKSTVFPMFCIMYLKFAELTFLCVYRFIYSAYSVKKEFTCMLLTFCTFTVGSPVNDLSIV